MGKARWLAGGGYVYPLPKFYFIDDQKFYICLPDQDFCEQMARFVRQRERERMERRRKEERGRDGEREIDCMVLYYKQSE